MNWNSTENEWLGFLNQVRKTRSNIGVTYAGAWFRGQRQAWDLNPGILRELSDIKNYISQLKNERKSQKKHLKACKRYAEKKNIINDKKVDFETANLERLDNLIYKNEKKISDDNHVLHGEGRAYVEYRFRSGTHQESSWKTLAEMQHYGIPTRLLDWSESFGIALSFALKDYIEELNIVWKEDRRNWREKSKNRKLNFSDVDALINSDVKAQPVLWVMNPYRMAKEATNESVLWDYTLLQEDDYFEAFINNHDKNSHKFSKPLPILSPWKDERIAAQEGVFTFHGTSKRPLNKIYGGSIIEKIPISHNAAIHGARFLFEFYGINQFSMFRDKDSLGQQVKNEFFI